MHKYSTIIILIILSIVVITVSGCTTKTAQNGTFGEKNISLDAISISNNVTGGHYVMDDGSKYYYIDGYLKNNNKYDAFHVKLNATAYDANGSIVATNNSAYLYSNSIPANGVTEFYMDFPDPNKIIVRYDVKIVDATNTL